MGCAVADYFPAQELTVFPGVTPKGCSETKTFTANIISPETGLPGVAPYTVNWYWNTSGIFNSTPQLLGVGASITVTNPACPRYYVKCEVISDDHVVASRIIKVDLGPVERCCTEEGEPGGGDTGGGHKVKSKSTLWPNPVIDGILHLGLKPQIEPCNYVITDAYGTMVTLGMLSDSDSIALPATCPSGVYYLQIQRLSESSQILPFVVLK